ncbi:MAG TPA: O-antigen ligase family protein [Candidatus Limnocylindria bacterium]
MTGGSDLRSAAFFGVVVTLAACAIDPAVYLPYLTPKRYALLLASAGALLLWAVTAPKASNGRLRLSALEITLAASSLWGVVTYLGPATQAGNWIWLPLAAFLLTLAVRQLFNPPARDAETSGVPPRVAALADLMTALWIVGSALAVHGLAEALGAGGFRPGDADVKTSVTSLIGTPNGFGAFMAAGIIAALASAVEARRRGVRLLLAGAALLQLAALVGNGSRGAVLGLVAAGLAVLWLRPRITSPWRRGPRAVVAGLAVLVAFALAGFLLHRLNPASTRGRLIAWEVSGAMLADRPLTGIGAGRFAAEWGRYQAELWRHPGYAEFDRQAVGRFQPNSELFHRLAEQGLPGGALYLLLWAFALGFLVRALRRQDRTTAVDWGLLALLVTILVHSLVDGALRWVPTLVTVHLAFGLIPAPALLDADLQRGWVRRLALAVAVAWAATVALKTLREYPGYQLWAKASRGSGAERLDLLVRAQRRLPSQPGLNHELGIGLLEVGRLEEGVSVLQRGLDAWDDAAARLVLAEAQLGLGWLEPAGVNARKVAAEYPDRLAPRLLLARIHHAKGEDAQARDALARSIRRDTHFRSADVDSVVAEATHLWRTWYDDDPPN